MTEPDDDTLASSEVRHRAVRGGIMTIGASGSTPANPATSL